jgi:hypothetical protein
MVPTTGEVRSSWVKLTTHWPAKFKVRMFVHKKETVSMDNEKTTKL